MRVENKKLYPNLFKTDPNSLSLFSLRFEKDTDALWLAKFNIPHLEKVKHIASVVKYLFAIACTYAHRNDSYTILLCRKYVLSYKFLPLNINKDSPKWWFSFRAFSILYLPRAHTQKYHSTCCLMQI